MVYTTNRRVWEHDEVFKVRLRAMRCIAIDMETATVFVAGLGNRIPSDVLLLVSDQPMVPEDVKTDVSDSRVSAEYVEGHNRHRSATVDPWPRQERAVRRMSAAADIVATLARCGVAQTGASPDTRRDPAHVSARDR